MRLTPRPLVLACAFSASVFAGSAPLFAQDKQEKPAAPAAAVDAEAKYTADINNRAQKIVDSLKLDDAAKATKVHGTVVNFYRTLRDWHDAHGPDRKAAAKLNTDDGKAKLAAIEADLAQVRQKFVDQLAADGLSADQIAAVKDGLTFNVRTVTYTAYLDMIPRLTDEEKQQIATWLTEARDLAISEGSSNDKHAVFGKYKGRINNYLSKRGYDQKKEEDAWRERLKQRRAQQQGNQQGATPSTKPAE
jgi:hypothetical protein